MFSIRSNSSDRELAFLDAHGDCYTVELRGVSLQATHTVYAYTDADGLASYFSRLAAHPGAWRGQEAWESLEGDFVIAAVCSTVGAVIFTITIRGATGAPEQWEASACIASELGQLPVIAAGARRLAGSG